MMDILDYMKFDLHERFGLTEKRPNIAQVTTPFYYGDGDMLDIFIDLPKTEGDPLVISDHGCTLMRLSCSFEIDANDATLSRTLAGSGIELRGDVLRIATARERLYDDLVRFAHAVTEVSAMRPPKCGSAQESVSAA